LKILRTFIRILCDCSVTYKIYSGVAVLPLMSEIEWLVCHAFV